MKLIINIKKKIKIDKGHKEAIQKERKINGDIYFKRLSALMNRSAKWARTRRLIFKGL